MAARQIQYEDLVPKSEWKDQPEATLLTIDLPGFAKEQIKVTYVHTSKMIRVTGERPVSDRRWSRFNEVFTVPQNCLVDKIHGSFKNNVLTITMPKETITKMPNLPESSKTVAEKVEKIEEKRLLEELRRKEKAEEAEKKKKKLLEEKEGLIRKLQEEAKGMAELRKLQEESKAKDMAEARKLQDEEAAKAKEKLQERKLVEEATLEKMIHERKSVDESGGKEKILKPEERKLPEVVYTKSGPRMVVVNTEPESETKPGFGREGQEVKPAEDKLGYLVEKEKKIGKGMIEKIRRKQITSEEKKLMMNVGVSALVIFALGAYVSYTICSSSSPSSSSSTKPE